MILVRCARAGKHRPALDWRGAAFMIRYSNSRLWRNWQTR